MDSEILSKTNRLFWLGRYVERTMIEIEVMMVAYDDAIDRNDFDFRTFCERLEIDCPYETSDGFILGYLFDKLLELFGQINSTGIHRPRDIIV